jgi:hypothetical protein
MMKQEPVTALAAPRNLIFMRNPFCEFYFNTVLPSNIYEIKKHSTPSLYSQLFRSNEF